VDIQKPLFWHQGLFLQPQHFQLFERAVSTSMLPFLRYQTPYFYGVGSVDIQEAALNNHNVHIMSGEFLFPDGTYARFPGNSVLQPRSFEDSWLEGGKPLKVFLGLKQWQNDSGNVSQVNSLEEASEQSSRYIALKNPEWVKDLHEGKTEGEIKFLHHALKIFWESELGELGNYSLIPLAQLHRDGDHIVISTSFIPPCLSIHASLPLKKILTEIRDQLVFRCHQLEELKRERGIQSAAFGSKDMIFLMALRSLARQVPSLDHALAAESLHPWQMYGVLCQLIGELSTFSSSINATGEETSGKKILPTYDHDNLWLCFSSAQQIIARLIDEITAGPDYIITLEYDGTFYSADLKPEAFEAGNRFYLVISTEENHADVASAMTTVAKASSREHLPILIARALPGVEIEHLQVPPQELPRRGQSVYFALNQHGQQWANVAQSHNLALYWDNPPEDLTIELMIVGRT